MTKAVKPADSNVRPDPSDQSLLSRGELQKAQEAQPEPDGVQSASDKALAQEKEKQRQEQQPDETRVGATTDTGEEVLITHSTKELPASPADIPSNQHMDGAGGVAGKLDGPTQSVTPAQNFNDVHQAPDKTSAGPK